LEDATKVPEATNKIILRMGWMEYGENEILFLFLKTGFFYIEYGENEILFLFLTMEKKNDSKLHRTTKRN